MRRAAHDRQFLRCPQMGVSVPVQFDHLVVMAADDEKCRRRHARERSLAGEIREAEGRLRARDEQGKRDELVVRERLAAVEKELAGLRSERTTLASGVPRNVLTDYERILKARGGLAIAPVTASAICGGCRVTIRPQAIQELKAATTLLHCESCGRYLYWQE